jgi:hypothetical protein
MPRYVKRGTHRQWQVRIDGYIRRHAERQLFVSNTDVEYYVEDREKRGSRTFTRLSEADLESYLDRLIQEGVIYDSMIPDTLLRLYKRYPTWRSRREREMGRDLRQRNKERAKHRVIYVDEPFKIDYSTGRYILSRPIKKGGRSGHV